MMSDKQLAFGTASGAGEPEGEVGDEEREKEWYGKVGARAQLAN